MEEAAEPNSETQFEPNSDPIPAKRGRGNPNAAGANPSGLPKAALKAALARADEAEAEVAALRAKIEDQGVKGEVKMLRVRVAELERELADLRKANAPVTDAGTALARETILAVLRDRPGAS